MNKKNKNSKEAKGENNDNFNSNNDKTDKVYNFLMFIALADLILMVVVIIIEDSFGLLNAEFTDFTENFLMITGIITLLLTFSWVQKFLNIFLRYGELGNHITLVFFVILCSVIFTAIFSKKINVPSLFRAFIDLACAVFTICRTHWKSV